MTLLYINFLARGQYLLSYVRVGFRVKARQTGSFGAKDYLWQSVVMIPVMNRVLGLSPYR